MVSNSATARFRSILSWICLGVAVGFVVYIACLKIIDLDFWWHLRAGEIMSETHKLISVEPFAYTRQGEPYRPRYEYMAQVVLYQLWHHWGPNGVITWRLFMAALVFSALLLIDRKSMWPNFLLIIFAAHVNRPAFLDRPQMFSYVFFGLWMWMCYSYLSTQEWRIKKRLLMAAIVLQVIWANFHGGANIVSLLAGGALVVDRWWQWRTSKTPKDWLELKYLLIFTGLIFLASVATPNTYGNYYYVFSLIGEKSNSLINEWQPRPVGVYLSDMVPFWIIACLALWQGKRNRIFGTLVLLGTGYLSLKAYRHGPFFTFAAAAIAFYELQYAVTWQNWLNKLAHYRLWTVLGTTALIALALFTLQTRYTNELLINDLYGFGVENYGQGAYNFLDQNNVQGRMYNTYNIGGYLIYRGYPNRKVFIDGRNVDYGYEFVNDALTARSDPTIWKKIDDKYNFDYAVIDYRGFQPEKGAYAEHLDENPQWALVYFDDWVSVYLKHTPQNEPIIQKTAYKYITPGKLNFGTIFDDKDHLNEIQDEMKRNAGESLVSIKVRLALAMYKVQNGQPAEGLALAQEAQQRYPRRAEPYEIMGIAYAQEHEWALAALTLEESIKHKSLAAPPVNYEFMAEVFSKAGDGDTALAYHKKYVRSGVDK